MLTNESWPPTGGEMPEASIEEQDIDHKLSLLSPTLSFTGNSSGVDAEPYLDPEIFLSKSSDPRWEESFNEASYNGIPNHWAYISSEHNQAEQSFFEANLGGEGI